MVAFEEHFWGEKYNGFDVLLQNFKLGTNASKELGEFVKERSSIEETYSKSLLKLSNKCSSAYNHIGSFEPCWKFLQSTTERLANAHQQVIQNLHEVGKAIKEYSEQQKEKQKQLKDDLSSTAEVVQNMQLLSGAVTKARESYQQKSADVDKCRKESNNIKEIEKTEHKLKKVCEEYKALVDKREVTRKDFGDKMIAIAKKFQVLEEEHLQRMSDILKIYGSSLSTERELLNQIINEFERNMLNFTIDSLLQQFVYAKQTGKTIPAPIEFVEIPLQAPPVDLEGLAGREEEKKKKKKEKRERKERRLRRRKPKTTENGVVQGPETPVETPVEVDEEGYRIRPPDTDSLRSGRSRESLSFDSDSDEDDEPRRIQVTIKPKEDGASNSVPSVEELRSLGAKLTLPSPSMLKKYSSDTKYGGSQTSIDKQSKLSVTSDPFPDSSVNSPDPWSESGSDKSLDVASNPNLSTTAINLQSSSNNSKFAALFDDSNFFTASSPTPAQDVSTESLNDKSFGEEKPEEEHPPPLPVKKRSPIIFQSEAPLEGKAGIAENDSTASKLSSPPLSQRPTSHSFTSGESTKPRERAYQLPVLAPPTNPRRPSSSNRQAYRSSQAANTSMSPPLSTPEAVPSQPAPVSSSSLMELIEIDFTPTSSQLPAPTPTSSLTSATSSEAGDAPVISVSPSVETRGDTQAFDSQSSTSSSPPSVPPEKVTRIAVAFIETVNAYFRGSDQSKCMLKVTGDMTVSFPAGIVPILTGENPPALTFAINGTSSLEQIFPNKALVDREGQVAGGSAMHFKFNVPALAAYLRKQSEQGNAVSYYNIDILKYQVRTDGVGSVPLHACAYWRCDDSHTDLKIDYRYNPGCMASPVPLSGVTVVVPVDGGVEIMQSKPTATWSGEHQRALWKIPRVPAVIDGLTRDSGCLRARFDVSKGPSTPATIGIQFSGEGSILSNLNFEVKSPSLKLSLVKKRFVTGKYILDP